MYHMIYPEDRWVTTDKLIMGAKDAIANHNLDSDYWDSIELTIDDAIDILAHTGEVTIAQEE